MVGNSQDYRVPINHSLLYNFIRDICLEVFFINENINVDR